MVPSLNLKALSSGLVVLGLVMVVREGGSIPPNLWLKRHKAGLKPNPETETDRHRLRQAGALAVYPKRQVEKVIAAQ